MKLSVVTGWSLGLILSCWGSVKGELTVIAETDKGPVRGEILKTVGEGTRYASFKGIPFAKPPINELRFKPPIEADPWTDVINATAEPPSCLQVGSFDKILRGKEDCLYLNVYTPKTKDFNIENDKLMAVMVWIYGGGFCEGMINSSFYGPDFLLDENVVVVAMNYRLGPLGFLSLDHPFATGNMGLKDQVLALKWVWRNIERFGGDPSRVTLFGQSAGAASVSFHQISEASSGLFAASIAMSGSALNPWALHTTENAVARGFELGRKLGLNTSSKEELLAKLYSTPPEVLTLQATKLSDPQYMPFRPTLENPEYSLDTFLSARPYCKYKSGRFSRTPTMLGFVEYETLVLKYEDRKALKDIVKLFHNSLHMDFNETDEMVNITSAAFIYTAGIDQMQQFLTARGVPVYYYKNSFDTFASLHRFLGYNLNGTSHADDLLHLFYPTNLFNKVFSDEPLVPHRKRLAKMWTDFAKGLDPTPYGNSDALLKVKWLPAGSAGEYLEIGQDGMKMQPSRPVHDIVKKWQVFAESASGTLNGLQIV